MGCLSTGRWRGLPECDAGRSFSTPLQWKASKPVKTLQDRNQTILDSLSEGILAVSSSGRVLSANRYVIELTGMDGHPENMDYEILFEGCDEIKTTVAAALNEGRHANHRDVTFEGPAGPCPLRVNTSTLDFDGDEGVVVVLRDVSDLRRLEREMFQAERMNALGRLAASVAHEVRNPLGAVNIQLQLLAEDADGLDEEIRASLLRRLAVADAEIKRLDRIVGNFLRFSRSPQLELASLNLNDVIRRVFELVTPEAREYGVRLELDLASDLPPIEGDENQLGQAILNLAVNAFHAIEGTGSLRATTSLDCETGTIKVTLVDDGHGIDPVDLDRVFELYYTTKAEGTGMGLSIAQRVIYEHGGRIEVESKPPEGTRFTLTLPIGADHRADADLTGARTRGR